MYTTAQGWTQNFLFNTAHQASPGHHNLRQLRWSLLNSMFALKFLCHALQWAPFSSSPELCWSTLCCKAISRQYMPFGCYSTSGGSCSMLLSLMHACYSIFCLSAWIFPCCFQRFLSFIFQMALLPIFLNKKFCTICTTVV